MANVVIRWMRPCALHIPAKGQRLILAPGDNELAPETWLAAKQTKGVRKRLEQGLLVEVPRIDPEAPALAAPPAPRGLAATPPESPTGPEPAPPAAPTEVLSADQSTALDRVAECTDLGLLRHWGSTERRPDVQTALVDRYRALGGKA